ncbi:MULTISPECIES: helix-turn-helix domain-containing protein [Microbacterium]|uniref:AraC-like ligand-binding domain-containing protein n=1 Tax=Microbacterium TaxID=33882 RepID=UPI00278B4512|nr:MULTISPECIES: helix-turn-helix domain-containing protein [Microbacterium]MDQ1083392.1 AraC-like DNA-binding protein [Microbacterium sp. SORGH_AS_0344]MDQ1171328.1 AraC-like DNA-binding protein [Microbacterium proteolyticum]
MHRWDTRERPPREQFAYWREVVCAAFTPLRPAARDTRDDWSRVGIEGRVESRPFGRTTGAEIATCAQVIHHGPDEVRRVADEVVFVNLMLGGRSVVSQDGRRSVSGPGTFSIVDATRSFTLDYLDPWRALSFRVPAADIPDGLRANATARTFSAATGLGAVVADTLRSSWEQSSRMNDNEADAVGVAVSSLTRALSHSTTTERVSDEQDGDVALRRSIERHLERHIRFVDTSPAAIARHFAISVRKLHQLYETAPHTFGQTVMRVRVQECADDLRAERGRVTMTHLAAKWGFSDLSHLHRAFRHHLGQTPRELVAQLDDDVASPERAG